MASDDRTVAAVLSEHTDHDRTAKMLCLVRGMADPAILDYEDWVRPMKLTGGEVCLQLAARDLPGLLYLRRTSGGNLLAYETASEGSRLIGSDEAKLLLAADVTTVTPVLRSETPFAGEEADADG